MINTEDENRFMEFDTAPLTSIIEDAELLERIASEFGTPVYVYSADRIRKNVTRIVEAMKAHLPDFQLYYAIKANQNPVLLRVMEQAYPNIGVDCSTRGELQLTLDAGLTGDRLVYTGNYESRQDLELALSVGLPINFDDVNSYRRCRKIGQPDLVSFRVNPGSGRGMYPGITTAGKGVKFGVPADVVAEAYQLAIDDGVRRFGLHTMVGSGILDNSYFAWNLTRILEIAAELEDRLGIVFEYIDMGGGFGIPYMESDRRLDVTVIFERVGQVMSKFYPGGDGPTLAYELGRYLVGDAGFILSRVLGTKQNDKYFVGLDFGMNALIRPALYDAYHRIVPVGEAAERPVMLTDVTGQICENTDRIARDRKLPGLQPDDLVTVLDTGAYGFCLASQYNGLPLPGEVLVDGDDTFLIREPETVSDLTRNVHMPEPMTGVRK